MGVANDAKVHGLPSPTAVVCLEAKGISESFSG